MSDFRQEYETAIGQLTQQEGSPFEIGKLEGGGVSYRGFVNAPTSLPQLLESARQFDQQEFIVFEGERWTFADYFNQVDRLANVLLTQMNIKSGMRVAIAMRNYPEWMVAWHAITAIGAIVVPLNSWGSAAELDYQLKDSEARVLLCDPQRLTLIDLSALQITALVARCGDAELPEGASKLSSLLEDTPAECPQVNTLEAPGAEDLAMIMYTSGTSGKPKGALFTHRSCCQAVINLELSAATAYMTNMEQFNAFLGKQLPSKALLAVPLFHVSGLYSQFLLNLRGGRTIVIMYKWDVIRACDLIAKEKITSVFGAPSMLMDLLQSAEFSRVDSSCIINITGGGASSPEKLSDLRSTVTPNAMAGAGWGMTETGGTGSTFTGAVARAKPKASGFISPVVELRFCNESGEEVPAGQPGEIWVKSPCNVCGYLNRESETAAQFQAGWFKSGDVGYVGEDGCMYICDRVKDVVIRGGENIYPIEIENCLLSMPGVDSVTAFGIDSEALGEELAVVVKASGDKSITENDVKRHCKNELAHFKVPGHVRFTSDPLPTNVTNKILKKVVKETFFPTTA